MSDKRERATELEYLKWFRLDVDLGPAESCIIDNMSRAFIMETGKDIPAGWNLYSDGETSTDDYEV
jgi:hypothetical protein